MEQTTEDSNISSKSILSSFLNNNLSKCVQKSMINFGVYSFINNQKEAL